MAAAKAFVDSVLTKYAVAVFSKTTCPYCTKAKNALSSFELKPEVYHVIELDKREDMHEIQDYLQSITGARLDPLILWVPYMYILFRTVPRVFISGSFFGGGDDTAAGKVNGVLEKKLAEANAI